MSRRRFFARLAILAIAWGAMWPLVSAARPAGAAIPSFICTQSGVQHPSAPSNADDDFHCPLCIASADAVPPPIVSVPPAPPPNDIAVAPPPCAAAHDLFSARLPPSRAPPALS